MWCLVDARDRLAGPLNNKRRSAGVPSTASSLRVDAHPSPLRGTDGASEQTAGVEIEPLHVRFGQ
jgi:hypothetical protein